MEASTEMTLKDTIALLKKYIPKGITYKDYRGIVEKHVLKGTSTGPIQTEALSQYTLLNHSRMKRGDKTVKVPQEIVEKFIHFSKNQTWLVITESWCGDAAQTLPAINALAQLSKNIDLKIILRDENLELMDAFLTQGARSIPKLIVFNNDTQIFEGTWGPRPTNATQMVTDYKKEHSSLTPEFKTDLQIWYNKDKFQNTLEDLSQLVD